MRKPIPLIEFYITNVCNLTCRGCNRFNNYNFKGHQYWDDHAREIEAWSTRLDIQRITIIGGEPTLNPDLEKWVSNLRRLWPTSLIMVQTNGTYQRPEHLTFWKKYRVGFGLSLHDPETADELKMQWKKHAGPFEAFVFHESAVIKENDHFRLHNSNPVNAFNCCDMKYDHTIFNGKLWKCPSMALIPEFAKQFDLRLDDEKKKLLDSYQPLTSECSDQELEDFIAQRDTLIPQCQFCPQELTWFSALGPEQNNLPQPDIGPAVRPDDLILIDGVWSNKH